MGKTIDISDELYAVVAQAASQDGLSLTAQAERWLLMGKELEGARMKSNS